MSSLLALLFLVCFGLLQAKLRARHNSAVMRYELTGFPGEESIMFQICLSGFGCAFEKFC